MSEVNQERRHATDVEFTYENVVAICPWCGQRNIYNRVSDLRDTEPIAHREVTCLAPDCQKRLIITGDSINAAYEMLVFDSYRLQEEKRYSSCILNLAQSFEAFFALFLRVEVLYRPFAADQDHDLSHFNELAAALFGKVRRFAFQDMRNLFLRRVLDKAPLASLEAAAEWIESLDGKPAGPVDAEIQSLPDRELSALLLRLKQCRVAEVRNQVVHKAAYRPTLQEVEDAPRETREILFSLAARLRLHGDDLNWYGCRSHEILHHHVGL